MMASLASLAWERSLSRACAHLRRDWLNVVRAGGEALPQCLGLRLVDAHGGALVVLPLVEQVTELVGGGAPVGVVAQRSGQCFSLLDNGGALGNGLGLGGLACLGDFGLLGLAGSLQLLVLGLECGKIAHDGWLGGFFTQELHGFVDFTGLDVRGSQAGGQQIELGLEIQETTGVQCQRLFLGDIRELAYLALGVAILDEDGAVVIHAAEGLGGLDITAVGSRAAVAAAGRQRAAWPPESSWRKAAGRARAVSAWKRGTESAPAWPRWPRVRVSLPALRAQRCLRVR